MVLSLYLEPCKERVLSESFNESITNRSEFFSFIIIFWDHCHICGLPLAKTSWCGAWLNTWLIGLDFMWLQKDMENYEIWQISSIPLNHIPTGLIVLLCTCCSCSLEHSAASSDWPSPIYPPRQSSRHFFWYPNAEKGTFHLCSNYNLTYLVKKISCPQHLFSACGIWHADSQKPPPNSHCS